METVIYITFLLNLIGVVQGLTMVAVLLWRGAKNQLNIIIASILVVLASFMANTLVQLRDIGPVFLFYQDVANSVLLLLGPLIYLLVRFYTDGGRLKWKHVVHFIPFLVYFPMSTWFGLSGGKALNGFMFLQAFHHLVIPWLWNLQMAIYLGVCFQIIFQKRGHVKDDFPWIRNLVIGLTLIWFLNLVLTAISRLVHPIPDEIMLNITVLFTFVVVSIVFKSFNDPVMQSTKSSLLRVGDEQKTMWLGQLNMLFKVKKVYQNQDLRLSILSDQIGMNERLLSSFIRDEYGQSFNEYLNTYRVNEVIRRLQTPDRKNYTIMALANESGFKSNSAFYKAFRQQTGLTPSAYLNQKK